MPFRCTLALLAALLPARAALVSYAADDAARFTFAGRVARGLDNSTPGGVTFDLEGTALLFSVANATFIGLTIADGTRGGARLGVYFDSEASSLSVVDPNPSASALPPTARVATLVTSREQALYTLGAGAQIAGLGPGGVLGVRVELLSEWSHMGDSPGGLFTIAAIVTDGAVQPAPQQPVRRILVIGDSLSAGPGAGATVPPSGAPCGDGVLLNDWGYTWDALLCRNFSAACEVVAQSGATLTGATYNVPMSLPYALGAMGAREWPAAARVAWSAPPDAVFIELGENDCLPLNCTAPAGRAVLAAAYVALARTLAAASPAGTGLPLFFTIANHERGQSLAMGDAVSALLTVGFTRAQFLNGTSPTVSGGVYIGNGCAGHPSAAQNALAAARMRPVVAAALGW